MIRVRPFHRAGREGTRITIHDRGAGIPREVQKMIFDPFFTTTELRRSGFGLRVSGNLVTKHRSTFRFYSSLRPGDSGTTFEVFFPTGPLTRQEYQREVA